MKHGIIFICLALIPTNLLLANPGVQQNLRGLWYDSYSDTKIEIKSHRKGIKARRIVYGRKKKWRTYYRMGRGVFDDCAGRTLIFLGRDRIEWRQGRRKRMVLRPYNSYDNYYRERRNGRYSDFDDYRTHRNRNDRDYFNRDRFCGEWYCRDRGLELRIEPYRDGFRARRPGQEWIYYNRYNDREYRDRKGNRYSFDGDELIWSSGRDRRNLRFKRR